jgi:hypothetical protein
MAFSRLATMRQLAAFALALGLGAATALGLVSCGGGEDAKLLPGATAAEITENLDAVKQLASEGECAGAAEATQEVSAQVEAVEGVDARLKQALKRGVARLSEVVTTCEEDTTEAVAPSSEATSAEGTKGSPGQEKKEEREKEKPQKEEPETPGTPTETTPETPPTTTTPAPPTEGGGTGAPGGVSPGTPVEPGGE